MSWRGVVCIVVAAVFAVPPAWGQTGAKKQTPANTRTLDATAQKLESDFLNGLSDLAGSYEEAGDVEKAKSMLQAILKVRPDAAQIKERLAAIEEAVFKDQQDVVDLDMSKGWVSTGVLVEKGKKVRLEAAGTYKLLLNDSVGPEGYRSEDGEAVFDAAPIGSLIGMVITPGTTPAYTKGQGPQPFPIGEKKEVAPGGTGLLVVRANAPAGAKCVGRLKVRVSGNFTEAPRQ